jgi:hypothetical protein
MESEYEFFCDSFFEISGGEQSKLQKRGANQLNT